MQALSDGDMAAVLALFAPGATVASPLQGEVPATEFYQDLDRATTRSRVDVLDVYEGSRAGSWAALLRYDWTLANGTRSVFECVDVFDVDDDGRFTRLRIYYDASSVRAAYEELGGDP